MAGPLSETFCRSILHIEVPLVVTLAAKRMQIDQVLKLVPGAMIQFDKPCEAPLTLEIGGQPVAEGEVVKIGDKFGIRINTIKRPAERFVDINELEK